MSNNEISVPRELIAEAALTLKLAGGNDGLADDLRALLDDEKVDENAHLPHRVESLSDFLSRGAAAPAKCAVCGQGAMACNDRGCHFFESGNGEPAAQPVPPAGGEPEIHKPWGEVGTEFVLLSDHRAHVTRLQAEVETLRAELDALKAKPQGEPTAEMEEAGCQAYMDADGMIGIMHRSSMGHAYRAMRALEPPAPVTVVLPERLQMHTRGLMDAPTVNHHIGWNACLDEVARLNSL